MMKSQILLLAVLMLFVGTPVWAQTSESYTKGIQAIEAKDYATARTMLFKALDESANKEETWYALGFVGQYTNDFALMIQAGKMVATLNPQRKDGWYLQAIGYFQGGMMDSVAMPARKLIEIDRDIAEKSNLIKILQVLSQDEKGRNDSVFSTPGASVSITLPASWSTKHIDDDKTLNWFVTLEPVVADTDMFSTGASIRWVRRMAGTFPLKSKTDIPYLIGFWRGYMAGQMAGVKIYSREQLDSSSITLGAWQGEVITERMQMFEESYELIKFDVVLAREDEIFTIVLECPSQYWPVYRPRFEAALRSIKLPK